jgi:hypothetical protein
LQGKFAQLPRESQGRGSRALALFALAENRCQLPRAEPAAGNGPRARTFARGDAFKTGDVADFVGRKPMLPPIRFPARL